MKPILLFAVLSMGFWQPSVNGLSEEPKENAPVDSGGVEQPLDTASPNRLEPIDIFCSYPAQELYDHWDNTEIHPYEFDPVLFFDTIKVSLTDQQHCGFVCPVKGRVSSHFGHRRYRYHHGIDIAIYSGTPVASAFDGVVRLARYSSSYGYVVVIRHENGLETLYAHLSRMKVKVNQAVEAGQLIGLSGRTGRATGSHLHFEMRYKGWSLDPKEWINFEEGMLRNAEFVLHPGKLKHLTRYARGYHTVKEGEDPCTIADKYSMEVERLCEKNNITMATNLQPGQKVKVR